MAGLEKMRPGDRVWWRDGSLRFFPAAKQSDGAYIIADCSEKDGTPIVRLEGGAAWFLASAFTTQTDLAAPATGPIRKEPSMAGLPNERPGVLKLRSDGTGHRVEFRTAAGEWEALRTVRKVTLTISAGGLSDAVLEVPAIHVDLETEAGQVFLAGLPPVEDARDRLTPSEVAAMQPGGDPAAKLGDLAAALWRRRLEMEGSQELALLLGAAIGAMREAAARARLHRVGDGEGNGDHG